ncbi:tetratricopeptide repeat protein 23-like [Ochotona curzoniae]|uniref:tetratricopeptide repeat protein 23-like n=1 Tax=Ochotona curzoniae TaxID=130825 RepID=UPI001B34FC48|nr:tetratricopeptide repeat protein 23-like [Ochotona curzoniae]
MQASPIRIPTVDNDTAWDFCFRLPQQTEIPTHQPADELNTACGSGESDDDTIAQTEEAAVDCMSLPREKLAQAQKKTAQLIKEKMNIQANKELIRCVILSRIIFGADHWKCAQALASLAYGYLTLRGLPAQAKKHAESAKTTLLTWKGSTISDKEKKEILEALVMLYYTLGVSWLLQNHGREAYSNLQKAERNMKELKELCKGSVCGLQVSEKDLTIALGRASLAIHRLNLALAYFEKAIDNVIAAKGDGTPDLISLYQEVAQIEQLRRNHDQAIQYLKQAHSVCVSSFTEVSPQTAEASALLAKAYAMSGDPQHKDAIETHFIKSISAYQVTLGSEESETLATIEEFCKWLVQNGEKQEAYRLLKSSLKSSVTNYSNCSEKLAETFYNMGRICFAEGDLGKAVQLLRKCLMIQILVYGNEHSKSRETKNLLTLLQRASASSSRWSRDAVPGRRNSCRDTEA